MRFYKATTLLALLGAANAASSWGFKDGSVTVAAKGAAEAVVEKFTSTERVKKDVTLGAGDSIKVALTTEEGSKAKRAHQAFLVLKEKTTGLEAPFPLTVKDSGKATLKITQKDLPIQHLSSESALEASIIVGSFGSSAATVTPVFDITLKRDPNGVAPSYEKPLRYGKLEEIHHIFRADPKNPPKIISLVFATAVLGTVPALFIGWLVLGANLNHIMEALTNAPVAHGWFFGSILTMEGVFVLYYTKWNLFQTLPAIALVGVFAFLSGNKALAEVQRRRLAGKR
ncbi:hypothetical protein K4F52_004102 [Lecanicillium sp. MT-2017a]|nr:hypothetical protein K4F52_004102 [Lecanicillium sp. MT-2017a]